MSAIVAPSRTTPGVTGVKAGLPVLSTDMAGVGRLLNWAHGQSMVVVPAYCPGNTVAAAANSSYFFREAPKYQAIQRVWAFTVRGTGASPEATVAVKVPYNAASTTGTFVVGSNRETLTSFLVVENRAAQSSAEEAISCNLAVTGKSVVVEQICCWDMPRPALAVGPSDNGVDLSTLVYRERIVDGTGESIGGLVDGTIAALAACRRVLMQWALPATTGEAKAVTVTSYANVFTSTTGTTMALARKLYRTSTTGTLSAKIYARTADTSDIADVRVTTTSGSSAVINIPTGSHAAFAWFGAPLTFTADCEKLTASDGLQGAAFDAITVEAKVTAGGDILYLASISIWEA